MVAVLLLVLAVTFVLRVQERKQAQAPKTSTGLVRKLLYTTLHRSSPLNLASSKTATAITTLRRH